MNSISGPFVAGDDPDRDIRCQDELQYAFRDLLNQAMDAGWSERESVEALIAIAENHMVSLVANDDTDTLVAMLKRTLGA
jgi:hypothetical protein